MAKAVCIYKRKIAMHIHYLHEYLPKATCSSSSCACSSSSCALAFLQHGGLRVVGILTWWLSSTRANVPMNKAEAASPFMTQLWKYTASLLLYTVGLPSKVQPRFKQRQIRLHLLVGERQGCIAEEPLGWRISLQPSLEKKAYHVSPRIT